MCKCTNVQNHYGLRCMTMGSVPNSRVVAQIYFQLNNDTVCHPSIINVHFRCIMPRTNFCTIRKRDKNTHTRTHARMHARTRTQTHTQAHIHTHARAHTQIHTHTSTHTHTRAHKYNLNSATSSLFPIKIISNLLKTQRSPKMDAIILLTPSHLGV